MTQPSLSVEEFKWPDASDKKYKPLILEWLARTFGYENYPHSFKDQWINWTIWDNILTVSFDFRQDEQKKLFDHIPDRLKGCPQSRTLKIVNENSFYVPIVSIFRKEYPLIITSKLVNKIKHVDNDGDIFFVYYWRVELANGKAISYSNQAEKMDLAYRSYSYDHYIDTMNFCHFLESEYINYTKSLTNGR